MLLGATAGSLAAVILGFDRASMDAGLYAYNGALTGLCLATFHHGSDDDPGVCVCSVLSMPFRLCSECGSKYCGIGSGAAFRGGGQYRAALFARSPCVTLTLRYLLLG